MEVRRQGCAAGRDALPSARSPWLAAGRPARGAAPPWGPALHRPACRPGTGGVLAQQLRARRLGGGVRATCLGDHIARQQRNDGDRHLRAGAGEVGRHARLVAHEPDANLATLQANRASQAKALSHSHAASSTQPWVRAAQRHGKRTHRNNLDNPPAGSRGAAAGAVQHRGTPQRGAAAQRRSRRGGPTLPGGHRRQSRHQWRHGVHGVSDEPHTGALRRGGQ